jgi:hypothetical protein
MIVRMPMREYLAHPHLAGRILQGESWYGWRILLIAAAGEELTDDERQEFRRLTGREREPGKLCREFIAAAGRRAGKTEAMITFAIWIAVFCDHRGALLPGETGVVLLISQTQHWSREILARIEGALLHGDPEKSPAAVHDRSSYLRYYRPEQWHSHRSQIGVVPDPARSDLRGRYR